MDPTPEVGGARQSTNGGNGSDGDAHLELLHRISGRLAVADPLDEVLGQIVEFLNDVVGADSCFVYVL